MTHLDLIKEVLTRTWHGPILQTLVAGPLRYSKIGKALVQQVGERPGDGYISEELKALTALGLVTRQPVRGTRHHEWALTSEGRRVVDTLAIIGQDSHQQPSITAQNADSATVGSAAPEPPVTGSNGPAGARVPRHGRKPVRRPADRQAGARRVRAGGNMSDTADSAIPPDLARMLSRIDTSVPHPARRYNYLLGGKDHFAADRASGDKIAELMPTVRLAVLENRKFQTRVVRYLAGEAGIRQFLDIGTGIPAPDNVHEVAQALDPRCRVAYVDNDPVVLAHSRALLNSTREGATAYVEADVRAPEKILDDPEVRAALDFSRPIGLLMVALLHFVSDDEVTGVVTDLRDALPSGSYLAISHSTWEYTTPAELERLTAENASGRHGDFWPRTSAQGSQFFAGLELIPPGVVPIAEWRAAAEPQPRPTAKDVAIWGGVARVP